MRSLAQGGPFFRLGGGGVSIEFLAFHLQGKLLLLGTEAHPLPLASGDCVRLPEPESPSRVESAWTWILEAPGSEA